MQTFLKCRPNVRAGLLQNATHRFSGMRSPLLMERDYWLCFLVESLFAIEELSAQWLVRGDVSLAKSYQIISRFVDSCEIAVKSHYLLHAPKIASLLSDELSLRLRDYFPDSAWRIDSVTNEPQALTFHYPKSSLSYLQDATLTTFIKVEFSSVSDAVSCEKLAMTPYLCQATPELAQTIRPTPINTVPVIDTFWEKIALLQREQSRSAEEPIPRQISRHYYDVAQLHQHHVTERARHPVALGNSQALTLYKQTAAPQHWQLQPRACFLTALRQDYQNMADTYFGDMPSFSAILQIIADLETALNC